MQTRIYAVVQTEGNEVRLVEAGSAAQAIRHVVADKYIAKVATTKDVAFAMSTGIKVELAKTYAPATGTDTNPTPPGYEMDKTQQAESRP